METVAQSAATGNLCAMLSEVNLPLSFLIGETWRRHDIPFPGKILISLRQLFFGANQTDRIALASRFSKAVIAPELKIAAAGTESSNKYLARLDAGVSELDGITSMDGYFDFFTSCGITVLPEDIVAIVGFIDRGNLNFCNVAGQPGAWTLSNFRAGNASANDRFECSDVLEIKLAPEGQAALALILAQIPGLFATMTATSGDGRQQVFVRLYHGTAQAASRESLAFLIGGTPTTLAIDNTQFMVFLPGEVEDRIAGVFYPDDEAYKKFARDSAEKSEAALQTNTDGTQPFPGAEPAHIGISGWQLLRKNELPSF